MDVMAEANRMKAAGLPVISLAVGQPSASVPAQALDAARRFMEAGRIGYTDALGRASLRERIARQAVAAYGVALSPERVMVTTGSSAGFNLAFLAAFDEGDRVAIATPGYPAYRNILRALGLVPVDICVDATEGYLLTADRLLAEHRLEPLQGVLIASPANPTGTVTPRAEFERLIRVAEGEGITFISDEIYHGLVFGEPAASALEFTDRAILVNSFSKYYCMTGWRVGWLVLPPELVRVAERLAQSLYISPPELSQVAAEAVMDATAELDAIRDTYDANRRLLEVALPEIGFRDIAPVDGAFYAYAGVPEGKGQATAFARRVLAETHVAITPGTDFDPARGEDFVRLSYAGHPTEIATAVERLRRFLAKP
nr:aminotransferase class I/II-fold pyridoxal phosphate-dependent enzyme [Aureimonas sp. AU4]